MRTNHQYNYNYKLDQIFSREKSYDLHLKKLNEIKSKKSHSQSRVQHIEILEKRNSIRQQRRRFDLSEQSERINKGNSQLYYKITEICNRPMQQDYYKYEDENLHHPHNLNLTFRKIQAQQIQNENIKLADRLMKQEPVLKLDEYSHQYTENKRLMQRLQRYQQCQQYVNSIRNNLTLSNRDTTNNSSLSCKKKEKTQLQPILNVKNKSIDVSELEKINYLINQEEQSTLKELLQQEEKQQQQDEKNQTKQELPEIPQLNEESQIETLRQDEIVESQIQQQIDNEVKQQSEDDVEQQ
ncbi:unnamed protein product (macronuclear) [Paramecium tetraurelia]|uniref:Uncharacterized protein n=1 Tax=Paramecium tetraurelia TaxID=5888 RepID=A0EFP4_PARTE|nr:uncharacterized protein GSPATT00026458001 [Paramecium tetraurelia]CAK94135.1 unnamed protein product [Paramecium tetraurelia]|eukprot:XP_001461508.1 hypothetical protein (macronuclear) [Paramecium tetraurelia strain d4-2]